MKKILTNKDINFNSRSELINIQEECVFIIKSKLVSLENIIFFYTKILPTILLKNKNNIIVSPDFP
ncbi:MAG: hypothetical protein LBC61_06805 [Candidatus Peribacteria bacterium]|nr:hypothetical protein [Candidatus Peribacteria bacterium]